MMRGRHLIAAQILAILMFFGTLCPAFDINAGAFTKLACAVSGTAVAVLTVAIAETFGRAFIRAFFRAGDQS